MRSAHCARASMQKEASVDMTWSAWYGTADLHMAVVIELAVKLGCLRRCCGGLFSPEIPFGAREHECDGEKMVHPLSDICFDAGQSVWLL